MSMLANPYLLPPLVESPQSRSWGRGFAFGFQGPPASIPTPADIEDEEAFQQGVATGQQAATDGIDLGQDPCVDLHREPPPDLPELAWSGLELATLFKEAGHIAVKGFGGGIFTAVMLVLDLSIAFQTHFDSPTAALEDGATKLGDLLSELGIVDPMELFIGGGVDFDATGCELKLTPIFRSSDGASAAAQALGRPKSLVVRWRTNQSGGLEVVEFTE